MQTSIQAYRGKVLHFTNDPAHEPQITGRDAIPASLATLGLHSSLHFHDQQSVNFFNDGVLIISNGKVVAVGDYAELKKSLAPDALVQDYRDKLIVPGFIDTHLHYPQTDMIASPAEDLLPWLEKYTFPTERQFSDPAHAREVAQFFLDELLRCGTTSAMVYCSVHPQSVDAFLTESAARNCRMVAGKAMMDRNCPEFLRDTAESSAHDTEQIINKWHGRGRQLVAITPRFAASSTETQLQLAGELARKYPNVYVQTHVAESTYEVAWVKSLFPKARSYLDIYDTYGMLRPKSMFAHCIWLDDVDRTRMAQTQSATAICPTSNLFLGSGLFNFERAHAHPMLLSLATDVGAGTSFSMLQTMNEAYKVARMGGVHLSALSLFYLATLGGARCMQLEGTVGNFVKGAEADFIVLDLEATPLLARRTARAESLEELLFALAMLGDNRAVLATYVAGGLVSIKKNPPTAHKAGRWA